MAFVESPTAGFEEAGRWFELDGDALPSWVTWLPELKEDCRTVKKLFPSAIEMVEVMRYLPRTASRARRRIASSGDHVLTGERRTYYATSVSELRYTRPRGDEIGSFFSVRTLGVDAELTNFVTIALVAVGGQRWRVVPVDQYRLPLGCRVVREGDSYDVKKRP